MAVAANTSNNQENRMFRIIFAAALLCAPSIAFAETCIASQYGVGDGYHGKRTASGAIFNTYATSPYTAAHKTRPLGSFVTITNHRMVDRSTPR
jgi:rare lipoprotein A